jgi:hypothetical protein
MIAQDRLKELFTYADGQLICNKTGRVRLPTPITGCQRYPRLVVDGKAYRFHRLVFMYHYGVLPKIIDHIDNNRSNNRIENLREATQQQNCLNRIRHRNNKSGHKNVYWQANCNKWAVAITVNRARKSFGLFDDIELAALVAEEARNKYHGVFARSN